ncbi:aldose 1-epimerase family protein [Tautonia marina]|uniref:aldose 1-epimerase family protein n=1 Tax=Tautonia marina TaxID=2653855 RepID=UPI0013761DB0|nr:aldose 1-epimerase family protein [Tautonia marina]
MRIERDDLRIERQSDGTTITPASLGLPSTPSWSINARTLRGGRRDGVELIRVDNGALAFDIVATRGMGLWRGQFQGAPVGWTSPVGDGPVHPAHVNLAGLGGFGWLDGFDELLARCGLEHNGPPGQDGPFAHGLHGRIQNIPAHQVSIEVSEAPPHELVVTGQVDEARLFGPRLRMMTRYSTTPGSNRLVVRDEFVNLGDRPTPLVILYHWNLGPPYLEAGARVVAAAETVVPQTTRAAEGIGHYDTFGSPEPGFAEQVYLYTLKGAGPEGRTAVMLRNASGDKAFVLWFATSQLPCFTLWKNTMGPNEGYVTGLEPATNYPNPKDFERRQGRFVELAPGASHVAELTLELLGSADAVAAVEEEIQGLQSGNGPEVHPNPCEPFAPA